MTRRAMAAGRKTRTVLLDDARGQDACAGCDRLLHLRLREVGRRPREDRVSVMRVLAPYVMS
ncbi:hypothetical protein [Streptomyces sp. NPDC059742]|uniref:hypothetical protein n=1 Tax=Streptomyces sp. NPDC059742 TaxID=3346927 RepID=UPI003667E407